MADPAGLILHTLIGVLPSMTPLRILHTESSKVLGGQEFRTLSEAIGMTKRGHHVILAAQPDRRLKEYAEQYKLDIQPVTMTRTRCIHTVKVFLEVIRADHIDLVNTHGSIDSWLPLATVFSTIDCPMPS